MNGCWRWRETITNHYSLKKPLTSKNTIMSSTLRPPLSVGLSEFPPNRKMIFLQAGKEMLNVADRLYKCEDSAWGEILRKEDRGRKGGSYSVFVSVSVCVSVSSAVHAVHLRVQRSVKTPKTACQVVFCLGFSRNAMKTHKRYGGRLNPSPPWSHHLPLLF